MMISDILFLIPILNKYFDSSIIGAMKFVIFGGIMLYAINNYLRDKRLEYNYVIGLMFSFLVCCFGVVIHRVLFSIFIYISYGNIMSLNELFIRSFNFVPMILILALIIPLSFKNKEKEIRNGGETDILDENF